VNLSERDRRDLEELAGIFLSPSGGAPSPPAPAASTGEASPPRPAGSLVLLVSLTAPVPRGAGSPLLRAALATARPVSLPAGRPGEIHPLLRAEPATAPAPGHGPRVLPVSPRDGPVLRWGLVATSRVLAWLPPRPGLLRDLEALLLALREACPDPDLGWLREPSVPFAPAEAILADWRRRVPAARVTFLGTWSPGEPLPAAAHDFLAEAPAARLAPPAQIPR